MCPSTAPNHTWLIFSLIAAWHLSEIQGQETRGYSEANTIVATVAPKTPAPGPTCSVERRCPKRHRVSRGRNLGDGPPKTGRQPELLFGCCASRPPLCQIVQMNVSLSALRSENTCLDSILPRPMPDIVRCQALPLEDQLRTTRRMAKDARKNVAAERTLT